MRLQGLSDIIFDDLVQHGENKIIFISSLLVIPTLLITKDFESKLYTSKLLADNLRFYFLKNKKKLSRSNIVIMEPNVPHQITLSNGETIKVIAFEENSCSKNLVFMIEKDNRTTHIYSGACTEIREFIFNPAFCEWIQDGVDHLYVDISRALSLEERDIQELQKAINLIEDIMNTKPDYKIIVKTPKLGYEKFISALAENLRGLVFYKGSMFPILMYANKDKYFATKYEDAKISIVHKYYTLEQMDMTYKENKCIFIQITDKAMFKKRDSFREICWSPLPSPFQLHVLASICRPKRIQPITYNNIENCLIPQVPEYLLKLCSDYEIIIRDYQKVRNIEIELFQDNFTSPTTRKSHSPDVNLHMIMTQEVTHNRNNENRGASFVSEWLSSNQSQNEREELRQDGIGDQSIGKQTKFSIRKGSLKYLETSADL